MGRFFSPSRSQTEASTKFWSPSSSFQSARLLPMKGGVVTPTILWPVRSLKWDRNSWCDATLCVHLRKEKRQSKPDGKVHYFTSFSQCSTNPQPPTPSPPLSVGDLQCSETERAAESPIGQKIKVRGARLGLLEVTRWCDLHNLAGAR